MVSIIHIVRIIFFIVIIVYIVAINKIIWQRQVSIIVGVIILIIRVVVNRLVGPVGKEQTRVGLLAPPDRVDTINVVIRHWQGCGVHTVEQAASGEAEEKKIPLIVTWRGRESPS
jgi:hypothetical protein